MNIDDIPRLKEFCHDMLAWIQGGCGEHEVFTAKHGLCYNYKLFANYNNESCGDELLLYLNLETRALYPFGGLVQYKGEQYRRELYQNPERLQWLRDHAK